MINHWLRRKRQREESLRKAAFATEESELDFLSDKTWTPNKMGISKIGGTNIMFRSKWRWTLELRTRLGIIIVPEQYVNVKSRPHLSDMVSGVAKNYTFTKPGFKFQVTYIDIESWNFWEVHRKLENLPPYTNANLRLYDSCGLVMESWMLYNAQTYHTDLRPESAWNQTKSVLDVSFGFKSANYFNNMMKK